jgi:hypothetical protein
MTLAVAANLSHLVDRERHFVLLMTDSRFVFTQTGRHRDNGAKIWKLSANVGAVFAGDVEIGEKSLALVQKLFLKRDSITFETVCEDVKVGVERFRKADRPTHFVVGAVSPSGEVRLFKVDHNDGPVPTEVTERFVSVGYPDAQTSFSSELTQIPHEPPLDLFGQLGSDPLGEVHLQALPYVNTFSRALSHGGDTVGFPMQVVIITEYGEEALGVLGLVDSDSGGVVRVSAEPGEVRSMYREHERKQLPLQMADALSVETRGDARGVRRDGQEGAEAWSRIDTEKTITPTGRTYNSSNIYDRDGTVLAFVYTGSSNEIMYGDMDLGLQAIRGRKWGPSQICP